MAVPDMHVHGFTALEVTEGARRLGEDLTTYLGKDSTRHIDRNVSHWPHIRFAGEVRFTAEHVAQILALHERGSQAERAQPFAGQKTRGGRA